MSRLTGAAELDPHRGFEGRVALVTGAQRGIGHEIARALADAGCTVVASDVVRDGIERLADEHPSGRVHALIGDISSPDGVDDVVRGAVEAAGPVDILVNNAAILFNQNVVDLDMSTWDRTFDINLKAVVRSAHRVLPHMREQGFGRIVNISSLAGHIPRIGLAAYGAAKAGVTHLTRVIALENAAFGVTANLVAPGPTMTDMATASWGGGDLGRIDGMLRGVPEEFRLGMPIGRMIQPEEQANAVVFLARPESAAITGQTIHVNGGQFMS